ncbi:Uncharacterised protein [Vibrio cholerae]|nr:Uncharacterised protein [Vibrio cholerae]
MAAGCTANYPIRAGDHVNVKLGINLQRTQDNHIQPIHRRPFRAWVGVFVSRDFEMMRIAR